MQPLLGRWGHRRIADQFLKERPVMNHCLTQVFRGGLPPRLLKGDFVGLSVVFQDQRMIHGDICRALFKVTYRIAAGGHHIAQELVRFRDRTGGAVNEARLDSAPGLCEARAISCRERAKVERLDSFGALIEPGFPKAPAAAFLHGASLFSATELSAQSFSPTLAMQQKRGDAGNQNHAESDD
jgi:hypothetical protein